MGFAVRIVDRLQGCIYDHCALFIVSQPFADFWLFFRGVIYRHEAPWDIVQTSIGLLISDTSIQPVQRSIHNIRSFKSLSPVNVNRMDRIDSSNEMYTMHSRAEQSPIIYQMHQYVYLSSLWMPRALSSDRRHQDLEHSKQSLLIRIKHAWVDKKSFSEGQRVETSIALHESIT